MLVTLTAIGLAVASVLIKVELGVVLMAVAVVIVVVFLLGLVGEVRELILTDDVVVTVLVGDVDFEVVVTTTDFATGFVVDIVCLLVAAVVCPDEVLIEDRTLWPGFVRCLYLFGFSCSERSFNGASSPPAVDG